MSNSNSTTGTPSWLTLIMAILAGGWATQYLIPARQSSTPGSPTVATLDANDDTRGESIATNPDSTRSRLLAPLARHSGLTETCCANALLPHLAHVNHIEFLFVTVADPRDTVLGYRFDLQLDTLHKALAVDGYVLDQFYVPWEEDTKQQRWRYEPGVLVYRRPHQQEEVEKTTKLAGKTDLLLVLLIGEQPAAGIHQPAFEAAIRLISEVSVARSQTVPPVLISGPMFTGTAPSLARAIAAAKQRARSGSGLAWPVRTDLKVTVISGGAIGIDREAFLQTACHDDQSVEFRATVGHVKVLKDALIEYAHQRSFSYYFDEDSEQGFKVAWLTETVSGYGQSSLVDMTSGGHGHSSGVHVIEIPFPLGIAQVRATYEETRLAQQRQSPRLLDGRYRLRLGLDDTDSASEVPRLFTPQMTGPTNELVLGQILAMVRREGIRHVGISTSDVRDMIFLSQFIKQHYPTCQILLVSSDLVHLHPAYRQAMAGTLVASSYPLLPDALDWYDPIPPPRKNFVLSNQHFYGMFNSVRVLRQLQRQDQACSNPQQLASLAVDNYSHLIGYRPSPSDAAGCPPVWISMIGNDGIWPVRMEPYPEPENGVGATNYVVRTDWPEKKTPVVSRSITSRFACGSTMGYVIWLAFAALIATAACRDLQADWCAPLWLEPGTDSALAVQPHWFLAGLLLALWFSVTLLTGLAFMAIALSGRAPAASGRLWLATMFLLAATMVVATGLLRAFIRVISGGRGSSLVYWLTAGVCQSLLLFLALLLVSVLHDDWGNLTLWYNYTYNGFNGVSLILPLSLSLLAVVALCYGLLRQYLLISKHFVSRPHAQPGDDDKTKAKLLFPILARLGEPPRTEEARNPAAAAEAGAGATSESRRCFPVTPIVLSILFFLWFAWIGWQTVWTDAYCLPFGVFLALLLLACVLWSIRLIKTCLVLRQFQRDLTDFYEQLPNRTGQKPATYRKAWEVAIARRPARSRSVLGIILHMGRPPSSAERDRQKLEQDLREKQAANPGDPDFAHPEDDVHVLWVEQFVDQYLAHLRTLIRWLLVAGVLVFLAASSHPFNTAQYLRLTSSAMLAALGITVLYAYVNLDRNPLLSLILGTEPYKFQMDWNFMGNAGPVLLIAVITLLSQTFPDFWQWLGAIAEPTLGMPP